MTHYEKPATMIFRIIGVLLITASLILFTQAALSVLLVSQFQNTLLPANLSYLPYLPYLIYLVYLIAGMILFSISRFLAIWVCLDFDKFNERK